MKINFFFALFFLVSQVAQAKEIHIRSVSVKAGTLDPFAKIWASAQFVSIPLVKQIFVSPQGGGSIKSIRVRSLHTTDELFLHLEWEDKTKNKTLAPSGKFSDACAVQFPLKEGELPSSFMGSKDNPVNIWYWRAVAKETERYAKAYSDFYRQDAIETTVKFDDHSVQNLIAEGFGTLSTQTDKEIDGSAIWKEGKWSVVIKRNLTSQTGTNFKKDSAVPISFAVWDGARQDSDGAKSLSFWHYLLLGKAKIEQPAEPIERGKRVFNRYGCETCHGKNGAGGIKNINAQGGEVPPLNKLAEGFTEEEVKKVIRDGRHSEPEDISGPAPSLHMNSWKNIMTEQELNDLVKFLFSISPKTEEWR